MKAKHFLNWLIGNLTGCYNYGRDNAVYIIKNGKKHKCIFMPKGLKININGDNNTVMLELPLKFSNTRFSLKGDNNTLSFKNTKRQINDVSILLSDGSEVFIDENSSIGQGNFYLVANGNYKNSHKVIIGKNFRAGKDTIIRTSDGHSLIDPDTNIAINEPQDVLIGDNVWVMSRCMISKGAKIPANSAVAAYSFVNKKFDEENIMLAGIPAKIIKHNIKWDIRSYGKYMRDLEKENSIN